MAKKRKPAKKRECSHSFTVSEQMSGGLIVVCGRCGYSYPARLAQQFVVRRG